jgi:hypothetical protein
MVEGQVSGYELKKINESRRDRPDPGLRRLRGLHGSILFSITDESIFNLEHEYRIYAKAGRIPKAMLPIATDAGGNLVLLALGGSHSSNVFFWDHENEGEAVVGIRQVAYALSRDKLLDAHAVENVADIHGAILANGNVVAPEVVTRLRNNATSSRRVV